MLSLLHLPGWWPWTTTAQGHRVPAQTVIVTGWLDEELLVDGKTTCHLTGRVLRATGPRPDAIAVCVTADRPFWVLLGIDAALLDEPLEWLLARFADRAARDLRDATAAAVRMAARFREQAPPADPVDAAVAGGERPQRVEHPGIWADAELTDAYGTIESAAASLSDYLSVIRGPVVLLRAVSPGGRLTDEG